VEERFVKSDDELAKSVTAIQVILLKERMTSMKISIAMNSMYSKKRRLQHDTVAILPDQPSDTGR
jgi:hypothetical protein